MTHAISDEQAATILLALTRLNGQVCMMPYSGSLMGHVQQVPEQAGDDIASTIAESLIAIGRNLWLLKEAQVDGIDVLTGESEAYKALSRDVTAMRRVLGLA